MNYGASNTTVPVQQLMVADVALIVLLAQIVVKQVVEARKLPPGPWGPPVVGYLPFLGVRHQTFLKLARYYARGLFSAKLGNQLTTPWACRTLSEGITMSVGFSNEDVRFERLNNIIEEDMRLFGEVHYGEYAPLYNYLPGKSQAQEKVAKNREEMFAFYQTLIDEHRETLDFENSRDLIDVYLVEIEKSKTEVRAGELFEGRNHELQLKQILGDLFSAGMETIKSSLLFEGRDQSTSTIEEKRRVQEDIDAVVGRDRLPTIKDIILPNHPYIETTILETLYLSNLCLGQLPQKTSTLTAIE